MMKARVRIMDSRNGWKYYARENGRIKIFNSIGEAVKFLENKGFTMVTDWWYTNRVTKQDALIEDEQEKGNL